MELPHFVKYQVCPACLGTKWKREKCGYSMITCPICQGAGKLPMSSSDGQFMKR